MEFKQKAAPSRPLVKRNRKETDGKSVSSFLTEDSGVESLKPKKSRKSKESSKSKPPLTDVSNTQL